MRKLGFFAIVAFLVLILPPRALAATPEPYVDPFVIKGCENKDSVCHVPKIFVADQYQLSKGVQAALGFFLSIPVLSDFAGQIRNDILSWAGLVHPSGSEYRVSNDTIEGLFKQTFGAAFNELDPATLKTLQKLNQQAVIYSKNGILCVSNPQTGELIGRFISERVWKTATEEQKIPEATEGTDGIRQLYSIVGGHTQGTDFNLALAKQDKLSTPGCSDRPLDAKTIEQYMVKYEETNQYGIESPADTLVTWDVGEPPAHLRVTAAGGRGGPSSSAKAEQEDGYNVASLMGVPGRIVQGGYWSYIDQTACAYAGCSAADLATGTDFLDQQQKHNLTSNGTVVAPYLNSAQSAAFYARQRDGKNEQTYTQTITNEDITTQSHHEYLGRMVDGFTKMNCSIFNKDMQGQLLEKGIDCPDMALKSGAPVDNTVAQASEPNIRSSAISDSQNASSGRTVTPISPIFSVNPIASSLVPSCVLEGVATIEGAYEGGAPCKPNECGASGPFQITTGKCTKACGASSCPNEAKALGLSREQLCDFNTAAQGAARLLSGKAAAWGTPISPTAPPSSQKTAIINAADSYYGVGSPIQRLGGLSYGEFVYAHCNPSEKVTHVEHQVGHYPGTP